MKRTSNRLLHFLFMATCAMSTNAFAQDASWKDLPLNDMSSFKPQAGNWFIVGDVTMDPNVDVHPHKAPAPAEETGKKGSKKKKQEPAPVVKEPQAVTYKEGQGILLNINSEDKKSNLLTNLEHGDIDLELEVMLPKGSNSGLYLQGRYEVQLFDSWMERTGKFTDIGGIYRNWERGPEKSYMGKAPLSNAAKAPGLWQTLKVSFRAPRFNAAGEKIANARLVSVELNGVKIHDNVEIPLPTGGPVENNEKPLGPIMIQGDHGAVAIRNVRYRLMHTSEVSISNLGYKTFLGKFQSPKDLATAKVDKSGTSPDLTWEVAGAEEEFGVIYTGTINIPEDDEYMFQVWGNGGTSLSVNSQPVQEGGGRRGRPTPVALKKGSYPFELAYINNSDWPRLAFYVSTATTYQKGLQSFNSFPPDNGMVSPILVKVESRPKLLRAFLDFNGQRNRRLTHTIGVGEPTGIHYVYDLKAGNVACVWRGDFVDATPMWHQRGDGSFRPLGVRQYLFTDPPLAALADANAAFPEVSTETDFRSKGYEVEGATGRPIFKYSYKGVEVIDKVYPTDNDRVLTREVSFKNTANVQGLYFKLAEGSNVLALPDGSFVIDDKHYYIKVLSAVKPTIRNGKNGQELVLPVDGTPVKYSIVW